MASRSTTDLSTRWFVAGRIHQYDTELRLGVLRLIAIVTLYAIHFVGYLSLEAKTAESQRFHNYASLLVVAWLLFAIVLVVALGRRVFPLWTGHAATSIDLLFLVSLATLGQRANSPLVYVFFLILVASALRFDLRLVWLTSVGCLVGYVFLLAVGDRADWFDDEHSVPPTTQGLTLASLLFCGLLCGQIVRRVRALAMELGGSPSG